MKIEEVLATLNRMTAEGVIDRYAIGGAVGATFYLEPISTLDVDVFVAFHPQHGSVLISPQPIFDYLKGLGYAMDKDYVVMAGGQFSSCRPPVSWWRRLWQKRSS